MNQDSQNLSQNQDQEGQPDAMPDRERVPDKQYARKQPDRNIISTPAAWLILLLLSAILGMIVYFALPSVVPEFGQATASSTQSGEALASLYDGVSNNYNNMKIVIIVLVVAIVTAGLCAFFNLIFLMGIITELTRIRKKLNDR